MGQPRLRFEELAPEGIAKLRALEHFLNAKAGLEANLREFVRLLASRLNGCEFCTKLHTAELHKMNESSDRIESLLDWRTSDAYTERERSALGWAEAVTNIQQGHAPDAVYESLRKHFTDVEITNLTFTIANINTWNRLAISLGAETQRG